MSKHRLWVIAVVAGMFIVVVGGWFLGVSPVLDQATAANAQVSTITTTNDANLAKLASLKKQFANIGPLDKQLAALRDSIPEQANASAFLSELNALSARYDVTLTSVTVNAATLFVKPTAPAAAGSSTATATPTPTPTPTPSAPAATTPVVRPANTFVLVPVSISVSGAFNDVRDFVGAVQGGSRLYLATQVSIGSSESEATGTLTGDIFTLQGTSDPTPQGTGADGAAATAPVSTPAPTDTPVPSDTPTTPAP